MKARGGAEVVFARAGFSLIELMVVTAIIAILAASIAPMFVDSVKSMRADRSVRDLLNVMKYAQERAVADGVEYRVYLSKDRKTRRNSYWVMRFAKMDGFEKVFFRAPEPYLRKTYFPKEIEIDRIAARKDKEEGAQFIAFYANGACDYATVALRKNRDRVTIRTKGRLGQFDVAG